MFADRVLEYRGTVGGILDVLGVLGQSRFDVVLDFQGNLRSALLGSLPQSHQLWGFAEGISREGAWRLYTKTHDPSESVQSRLDRGISLVEAASGRTAGFAMPQFPVSTDQVAKAQSLISGGYTIGLVMGTSLKGRYKSWPMERWIRFVRESDPDWKFLLVIGPGDSLPLELVNHPRCRAAPCTNPIELLEILRACRVVMGADTGPMHLAHLLNKPTLALFGPKDPASYGPQYNRHRVIWHRQVCGPCRNWRCDHVSCMWAISTEEATLALGELLEVS